MDIINDYLNCSVLVGINGQVNPVNRFLLVFDISQSHVVECNGIVLPPHLCIGTIYDLFVKDDGVITLELKNEVVDIQKVQESYFNNILIFLKNCCKMDDDLIQQSMDEMKLQLWEHHILKTQEDHLLFKRLIEKSQELVLFNLVYLESNQIKSSLFLSKKKLLVSNFIKKAQDQLKISFSSITNQGINLPPFMTVGSFKNYFYGSDLCVTVVLK
ncbi:hypothetical protein EHI8A_089510 [Entamoeba histolytica HM-1:IMSS-B]|uniref:Uncharacterized protein n=6 Tax=Entamoeba histolytica TaxID=5759 RepID=C4LUK5_ENTH1|nr:hypothetical protein EHI_022920 [Entamoeba histolytica HM-1:IMSS]EMD46483.1 Hypothetical protein EHI5A_127430 [Entamoeba histolytica KU27]EMH75933.1 hypothetical protein EHI8A_089510 [Entamoeba histolytica HM-1:IMSS-B]EMS11204.1 hypothetical protein KM1_083680 [Entamoeba histolytica HM-3:IMSS]ENY62478.1 hypothetical protein EHI7A_087670 [Entamoeba histolytica HM-1:IMSS-A]GAT92302.1 hypothetical protein CL6EHI_022920 [Entamoeba histolytica]|eukprot:XP_653486.1 hypothetical protein EHI_022920 [Entamoeba histolytica HM-1:IMSS]